MGCVPINFAVVANCGHRVSDNMVSPTIGDIILVI